MTDSPPPQRVRVVVCRGQYCNMDRRADKLLKILEPAVQQINADRYPSPIKLEIANCLSLCGAGPNVILYPAGTVFNGVDSAMMEQIIETHLLTLKQAP